MATYYAELTGGEIVASVEFDGGVIYAQQSFSGGEIYPSGGGGGSANLQTLNLAYTPSESPISETKLPSPGYDGFDEVDVSVSAIPSTYVGSGITRRTSSDLTASGATVTAPSGYYENSASKAIPNADDPYIDAATIDASGNLTVDIETDTGGWIPNNTYRSTLPNAFLVQAAQTIYPSTSDQTILSGQYLTGTQTFKAVTYSGLLAENIKKDVVVEIGDSADSDRVLRLVGTYEGNTGGSWVEETISTSGAVTKALDPYTLYHFTGTLTSLTITLNAPSAGQIAHYHFDFESGSTPATLSVPNSVTMPDDFSVEAGMRYEVDILNDYGTVTAWTA